MDTLLSESAQLEGELMEFFGIQTFQNSKRYKASKILCGIIFEHAQSSKMLIASGNFSSAISLVRLQYEGLVRAMWLLYSASDIAVEQLMAELTNENSKRAEKLPMMSEMLSKLEGKAPSQAIELLQEFKEYS